MKMWQYVLGWLLPLLYNHHAMIHGYHGEPPKEMMLKLLVEEARQTGFPLKKVTTFQHNITVRQVMPW